MTEHTQGPWSACKAGDCQCGLIWDATENCLVAVAQGETEHLSTLGEPYCVPTDDAQHANARLIAAAPELLAACKAMLKYMDDGYLVRSTNDDEKSDWALRAIPFVKDLGAMHAAIAKATGKHHALS